MTRYRVSATEPDRTDSLIRIIRAFDDFGDSISFHDADEAWRAASYANAVSWMSLPDASADIVSLLRPYLESY